jgi:DNA invertase Pin-like site-specific DNA recombinase
VKAVAYIRVSSMGQLDGHSLDAQERLFGELCKNRGWEPVKVYREEGRSAHVESIARRPVFKHLLDEAGRGLFDVVVVHTLDRWSRNLKVTIETVSLLAKHNVGLVSITESIDWSNPQGRLFTQMLGAFAEYFSESLATHVKKGQEQRAREGRHTGGIPFGYASCWVKTEGRRELACEEEHPGGLHVDLTEGPTVAEMFRRYATGNTTLAQLAGWLNDTGFRTRNMHKYSDRVGEVISGPRLFTTASVRVILHNPFYSGLIKHNDSLYEGLHQPLVSRDVFDTVQLMMRKNSGRSETLHTRPERHYLLKGLIRCAYCGMPMWAQTYNSGKRYYREHRASRGLMQCPAGGGSVQCDVADDQVGMLVQAITLNTDWIDQVMTLINLQDQVDHVRDHRQLLEERLRRLARAYVDNLYSETDYQREKRYIEMEMESLVVPEADAAQNAGRLIEHLSTLWDEAKMEERRNLLLTMLDGIYFDTKEEKSIVAIKPKPAFMPIFQVAVTREGSDVVLLREDPLPALPPEAGHANTCSWWRRGGVERGLERGLTNYLVVAIVASWANRRIPALIPTH